MSRSLEGFFEQQRNLVEEKREQRQKEEADFHAQRDAIREQSVAFNFSNWKPLLEEEEPNENAQRLQRIAAHRAKRREDRPNLTPEDKSAARADILALQDAGHINPSAHRSNPERAYAKGPLNVTQDFLDQHPEFFADRPDLIGQIGGGPAGVRRAHDERVARRAERGQAAAPRPERAQRQPTPAAAPTPTNAQSNTPLPGNATQLESLSNYMLYLMHHQPEGLGFPGVNMNDENLSKETIQGILGNMTGDREAKHVNSSFKQAKALTKWLQERNPEINLKQYKYGRSGEDISQIPEGNRSETYENIKKNLFQKITPQQKRELFDSDQQNSYDPSDTFMINGEKEEEIAEKYQALLDGDIEDPRELMQAIALLQKGLMNSNDLLPISLKDVPEGRGASAEGYNMEDLEGEGLKAKVMSMLGPVQMGLNLSHDVGDSNQTKFNLNAISFTYALRMLAENAMENGDTTPLDYLMNYRLNDVSTNPGYLQQNYRRTWDDRTPMSKEDIISKRDEFKEEMNRAKEVHNDPNLTDRQKNAAEKKIKKLAEDYRKHMEKARNYRTGEGSTWPKAGAQMGLPPIAETMKHLERIIHDKNGHQTGAQGEGGEKWMIPELGESFSDMPGEYNDNGIEQGHVQYWARMLDQIAEYSNDPDNKRILENGDTHRGFITDIADGINVGNNKYQQNKEGANHEDFIKLLGNLDKISQGPGEDSEGWEQLKRNTNIGMGYEDEQDHPFNFTHLDEGGKDERMQQQIRNALLRIRTIHSYQELWKRGMLGDEIGPLMMKGAKRQTDSHTPLMPYLKLDTDYGTPKPKRPDVRLEKYLGASLTTWFLTT